MNMRNFKTDPSQTEYILFINGKPVSKYDAALSAKWAMEEMQKLHPNWKYEVRREVCRIDDQPLIFKESLNINDVREFKTVFANFLQFVQEKLELSNLPKIKFLDQVEPGDQPTFGKFNPSTNTLEIGITNRHIMDIFRTVAHELIHYKQSLDNQRQLNGDTGSKDENQANAGAGILMRKFGLEYPELYGKKPLVEQNDDQDNNLPSVNQAKSAIPEILKAAQKIYNDWDESDRDTYAGGGICHIIADAICDVMWNIGIECTTVSCSYEQHVYVAVKVSEGIYNIDIPYSIYEVGGGFNWKKLPDIKFDTGDVVFYRVSGDPDDWKNYIDENTDRKHVLETIYRSTYQPLINTIKKKIPVIEELEIRPLEKIVVNKIKQTLTNFYLKKDLKNIRIRQDVGDPDIFHVVGSYPFGELVDITYRFDRLSEKLQYLDTFTYQNKKFENIEYAGINESVLKTDVPNPEWLQNKINYAKKNGRDSWGAPYFGSTTAYVSGDPPRVSLDILSKLPGMRGEQRNIRYKDLEWLMTYMKKNGRLPLSAHGDEYLPFIMVAYNGEAWVNEGNHRIMAAHRLGWKDLPIEIKYFDGGERIKTGPLHPDKIGLLR